ncbi:MAG: Fe-S oxidoreductase, partial [Labilithrix sp.]|nr:Fe-S oxidoreductase [Labilithrix sp.]
ECTGYVALEMIAFSPLDRTCAAFSTVSTLFPPPRYVTSSWRTLESWSFRGRLGVSSGPMKILGKSRGVAAVIAAAIGLSVGTAGVTVSTTASAQLAPTGLPTPPAPPSPSPPAKPGPAGQPATPAAAKPTAPAAGTAKPAAPAAPAAGAAPAKPADPRALMASGEKKFKAGDFAGALSDFEAANTAKASPEADRFIGLSQDNLGHFPEAVVAYERFLANVPAKMKEQGDETKKRVEAIKAMPGKVHVETTPAGAQVIVDAAAANPNAPPATHPTPADLDLAAGHHTLRITAEGFAPADKEIDVTFASKQDVRIELVKSEPPPPPPPPVVAEAPPPAAPPPPPPPEPRSKVPAYVTGAVAIVATGVGIGFGVKALSQSSDFDKNPTTKKADDGENNALVADMMFGIAITFGVTSAVLFLSNDAPATAKADPKNTVRAAQAAPVKKAPAKITVTPAPYVTPTGGGASALVRF